MNFKKSTFVEKALKGSQEGSSPWAAIAGAVGLQPQIDLVQDKTVSSPWGCKSGTTLLKSGKSQTDQTRQPGAFVQPRVVTSKLGCVCTERRIKPRQMCVSRAHSSSCSQLSPATVLEHLPEQVSLQPRANPSPVETDTSSSIWSRGEGYLTGVTPINTLEMRFLTSKEDDLDSHFLLLKISSNLADDTTLFPGV